MARKIWFIVKDHGMALWKDLRAGTIALAFILVAAILVGAIINLLDTISSHIFENAYARIATGLLLTILIGIGSRLLQKTSWFPFKKWIPKEFLNKPEVAYWTVPDIEMKLGILIQIHSINVNGIIRQMGEVVPVQGGPTSGGHISGTLVDMQSIYYTKRTYGQALASCMSFGVKTTPITNI